MTSPTRALLSIACAALLFARSAPAGEPPASALSAGAAVRAALPVPEEEKGLAFEAAGDIEVDGAFAGTVKFSVDVGEYKEKPVWLVGEERVDEGGGGGRRTTSSSVYLSRDLALLRGDWEQSTGASSVRFDFVRGEKGLAVTRTATVQGAAQEPKEFVVPVPAGATWGRGAILLFLKYAPADAATYALPWLRLEDVLAGSEHDPAPVATPAALEVVGAAKFGEGRGAVDSWMATWTDGVRTTEYHLSPKGRGLLGIERRKPTAERVVPAGAAKKSADLAEDKPARTWKDAFFKFGYGYHLAVERWIVASFHWPSIYEYEVKAGIWNKSEGETIDVYRKANVEEFLKKSKHRPRAEAAALLKMTLGTGSEKTEEDGTVVLSTHPEFGGNVFHFKKVGDEWFIVRIDQ
jgi:hypothetical protein